MKLFTIYNVECNYNWELEFAPELLHSNTFSFATLAGARAWVERHREELLWYAIEGEEAHPCLEDDPDGQLYYGMIHYEYHDLRKEAAAE